MDRRAVIRLSALSVAGVGGCLSNAPGKTGPRNPPHETTRETAGQSAVRVAEVGTEAADGGRLRVVGTVENGTGQAVARTVLVTATVEGRSYEAETDVTVEAESTAEFAVQFDTSYEAFNRSGSLHVELSN